MMNVIRSVFCGGNIAFILALGVIIQTIISTFLFFQGDQSNKQELLSYLRVSIVLAFELICGLDKASFIVIIIVRNIRNGLFICWGLHSISFLVFFLNILQTQEFFNSYNNFDLAYRIVFFAILISNSFFFIFFVFFMIILSMLALFFPSIRLMFDRLNQIHDLFIIEEPVNPEYRPLDEIELEELDSFSYDQKSVESMCAICFEEKLDRNKVMSVGNCQHNFHSPCLKQWLRNRPNCPICKRNIRDVQNQDAANL